MRNFDVHVCLVSKQPLPNLIPILVSDPKPKEVILLVSHEMNERAGWLETVLKTYHIHVSKVSIADSYDKEALENQMLDLKLFENYTSQNILMNITGGTKLMAISAYSVFSANDSVCAYFVERSNELVYLDQAGQKFVLEPKLKIKDILLAHGGVAPAIAAARPCFSRRPCAPHKRRPIRDVAAFRRCRHSGG